MNIVICDDDKLFIKNLKSNIESIILNSYPSATFFTFNDGSELISWYSYNRTSIDILFIDIRMPVYNGLQTMHDLYNQYNCRPYTVFISSYEEYVMDSFDFDVKQYLLKPIVPERLTKTVCKILDLYKTEHFMIQIPYHSKYISLSVYNIILIESSSGILTYHTLHENYTVRGSMKDMEKLLKPFNFLRTHKSFLINMDKVLYYEHYKFYLTNNLIAEISRTRRSQIIETYQNYICRRSIF